MDKISKKRREEILLEEFIKLGRVIRDKAKENFKKKE